MKEIDIENVGIPNGGAQPVDNDIQAEVDKILAAYPEEISLNQVYDVISLFNSFGSLYPKSKDKIDALMGDTVLAFTELQTGKPYGFGLVSTSENSMTTNMFIRDEDDKKRLATLIARAGKICEEILPTVRAMPTVYTNVIKTYKGMIDQLKNGDYDRLCKADHMYPYAMQSTFLTLPTDEFSTGFIDEKGKIVYENDARRYKKLMDKYDFIEQALDRQNFMANHYLFYQEKKKAGTLTDEDVREFKIAYRDFLDGQKRHFTKIKKITMEDKDVAENRSAIGNKSFLMNWTTSRFGDPVFKEVELSNTFIENGWPEDDIGFLRQLTRVYNSLQVVATAKQGYKKEDKDKALDALAIFDPAYRKIMSEKISTPKERMDLINAITPGINAYLTLGKAMVGNLDDRRIYKDDVIKELLSNVTNRLVLPSEVGSVPIRSELEYRDAFSDKEKADRAREIYKNLPTLEEKFDFLVKYNTFKIHQGSLHDEVSDEESRAYDDILKSFKRDYLSSGDSGYRARVLKVLGRRYAEISDAMYLDSKKIVDSLPADDKRRQMKGDYYARMCSDAGAYLPALNELSNEISYHLDTDKGFISDIKKRMDFTNDTTYSDIAAMVGITDPTQIQLFANGENASVDEKVSVAIQTAYFGTKLTPDEILKHASEVYSRAIQFKFRYEGLRHVYSKKGYTPEEIEKRTLMMTQNREELGGEKKIEEWIAENSKMLEARKVSGMLKARYDLYETYYRDYMEKKPLMDASKARKELPAEEAYPFIFAKNQEGGYINTGKPAKDQIDQMIIDLDINPQASLYHSVNERINLLAVNDNGKVSMDAIGIPNLSGLDSIFTLWVLGAHPEVDINEITCFEEDPALVEGFRAFCEANPTALADSEEAFVAAVEKWGEVFKTATDRMKSFTFPSGDHSDLDIIKKNMEILNKLAKLPLNFIQEKDRIFKNRHGVFAPGVVADKIGQNEYEDMMRFWGSVSNLVAPIEDAYFKSVTSEMEVSAGTCYEKLFVKAVNRAITAGFMKKVEGKSLSESTKIMGAKSDYMYTLVSNIPVMMEGGEINPAYAELIDFDRKDVVDYLKGKNKENFEKKIDSLLEKLDVRFKKDHLIKESTSANLAFRRNNLRGEAKQIIENMPDTAEAVTEFVRSDRPIDCYGDDIHDKYKPYEFIRLTMGQLFSENYSSCIHAAGLKRMDAILVDGKTPAEMWGKKYGKLDPKTRDRCIELELIRSIAKGEKSVSIKTFGYDGTNKIKVIGTTVINRSAADLRNLKRDYLVMKTGLSKIEDKLKAYQDVLLTTHENKNVEAARQEIGRVGSDLYKNMERTLNLALKAVRNPNQTLKGIESKLRDFKEASTEYYQERKSYFRKRKQEGRDRIGIAEAAANDMPNIMMTFEDLARSLKSDIQVNESLTFSEARISDMGEFLQNSDFATKLDGTYGLKDHTISEEERNERYNATYSLASEKVKVVSALNKGLEDMKKKASDLVKKNPREKADPYDMAIACAVDDYMKRIETGLENEQQAADLKAEIEQSFNSGAFKRDALKLSKNLVFQDVVKHNRTTFNSEWKKIQKKTDESIANMNDILQSMITKDHDMSRYIISGSFSKDAVIKNGPEALAKKYDRLGDIVSMQILTDPANRVVVQAIESGRIDFKEVVKNTIDCLKQNRVLDPAKLDLGSLRESICNGDLMRLTKEAVVKQAGNKTKQYSPQVKKDTPVRTR